MKLVGENAFCKFYTNFITESLTQYCVSDTYELPKLDGYAVFVCEDKTTGERSYVLFDDNGTPIRTSTQSDYINTEIAKLKFLKEITEIDS